jgi:hypothetical protein
VILNALDLEGMSTRNERKVSGFVFLSLDLNNAWINYITFLYHFPSSIEEYLSGMNVVWKAANLG